MNRAVQNNAQLDKTVQYKWATYCALKSQALTLSSVCMNAADNLL